jgi:hypothetical protein
MLGGGAVEAGKHDTSLRVLERPVWAGAVCPEIVTRVERLTLGYLQAFEHYHRVTAGMVVTGLDITGREPDQHVHMLGLIVPVEDLDLDSMSQGQHVDIVLPIDVPAMSDMKC